MVQSASVEDLLEQGHAQLDRGQYQKGLKMFQQAAKLEPRNPQVLYGLGLAWYCLEDYQKSIDYLNKALQTKQSYILALAQRGLAYDRLNLIEQATVDFEQAIQIKPQDHKDWHGRGIGFAELQQYKDALVSFNNATKIKPEFYEAWTHHGITLAKLERYPEALTSIDKAIQLKPEYYKAWRFRGITLRNLGQNQKAITSFDRAIALKPDYAEAWMYRGITLANLRRFKDGLDSLNKAIEFKPDYSKAWMHHGITLGNSGGKAEKQKALTSFDKALEIQPNYAEAWMHRGITLATLGCHEEALISFDKALEIQPDYKDVEKERRRPLDALVKSKCYDAVFSSWDKIVKIKSDNAEAWLKRGYALYKRGHVEDAINSYDKALDIDPNYAEAWYSKGFALKHLRRLEEAIESYDKALDLDERYAKAWYSLGDALQSLGELQEAFESYNQAVTIEPKFKHAWYNRSKVLSKLNRYTKALNSYECTLNLAPEDYYAWNGKGNALRSLERYQEAIDCYQEALRLSNNQHYWSWKDIGLVYQYLGQYKSALSRWDKGLELLQPETLNYREGCGVLHHSKGKAHYIEGRKQRNSFEYWQKAQESYQEALKLLTDEKFSELRLVVLQDLIEVHLGLGEIAEVKQLEREGSALLARLLASSPSFGKKKQLNLKYAGFNQLTVDIFVQSGELLQALKTAEEGKNTCLKWLLWNEDISTPSYKEIEQILNPSTAIIYWHLSPAALNTFILKHGELEPVLLAASATEAQAQDESPASMRRLQKFESWLSDWNQQYGDYRNTKTKANKENHPWRKGMQDKLEELKDQILNVPGLEQELAGITQLILIPHRDLHRFPLHALFSESYTITYLPSAQIGLQLPESGFRHWESGDTLYLLSVENPKHTNEKTKNADLVLAEIESEMICQMPMFSYPNRIGSTNATQEQVKAKLQQPHSIFHFTGHGAYNFDHPEESALFLSGTDRLTIKEISSLKLSNYQLVCLSACETALTGNQTITDEYVGLVSGFIRSGVARVVSTLWTVHSQASTLVMVKFYRQLYNGKSEVAALTEATRWLRHLTNRQLADWYKSLQNNLPSDEGTVYDFLEDELSRLNKMSIRELDEQPYNHPYYWAAFTITGKP